MANLEQLYRQILGQRLTGSGGAADQFEASAARRAQAAAQGIGAGMAGLAPALAARQAQQAAAQQSIGVGADAARMRAQEQAQGLQAAAQQIAADRQRSDNFLGAGLQAGGTALAQLLQGASAFGGQGPAGAAPMAPQTRPQAAPAVNAAPRVRTPVSPAPQQPAGAADPIAALLQIGRTAAPIAGMAAGGPVGGLAAGGGLSVLEQLLPMLGRRVA